MGVRFVDGNNQPTGEYGLVVTSVYPDSPASEAGFRRGTFFAQYNGAAITAANLNSVYGTLIAPEAQARSSSPKTSRERSPYRSRHAKYTPIR